MSGFRLQTIYALASARVNSSLEVAGDADDAIAGHPASGVESFDPQLLVPGVFDSAKSTVRSDPQPVSVGKQREDCPPRHAVALLEVFELVAVIAVQPAGIQPHPDVPLRVLGERAHQVVARPAGELWRGE